MRLMHSPVSHGGAIGLALAGFTFWVLADTSMKLAGNSRLPAYEIIACLGVVIAAVLVLRGFLQGTPQRLLPRSPARQLVRSCLDLANNLCVVVALRHLPLTLFYILVFLAPMVTALLTAVFLRERLGWRKVLAIVGGFAGRGDCRQSVPRRQAGRLDRLCGMHGVRGLLLREHGVVARADAHRDP